MRWTAYVHLITSDNFYRFKRLCDKGGELALQEISCKKPVLKNRMPQEMEDATPPNTLESVWHQCIDYTLVYFR